MKPVVFKQLNFLLEVMNNKNEVYRASISVFQKFKGLFKQLKKNLSLLYLLKLKKFKLFKLFRLIIL